MPIRVECPSCQAAFRVHDDQAGRRGRCPRCKSPIEVPSGPPEPDPELVPIEPPRARAPAADSAAVEGEEIYGLAGGGAKARAAPLRASSAAGRLAVTAAGVAQAAAPTRPTQTPAQVLAAFRGEIEPVRPTPLYLFWAAVVAGMMVLLPAAYVGMIGLVLYGLVLHAVHDVSVFRSVHNTKAAFALYAGPLAAGAVVVAFLLKPLFAGRARAGKSRELDPQVEPLLFAFVDGVCASPRPVRIEVDCQVNASAHLAGGMLSAVFGRQLVLTIGLPLAAGMTLRQFAGVLAHEFGHFSQGAGMRLSFLIWSINAWFARVVYERDEWDETLEAWSKGGNAYAMLLAIAARGAVWLARRVLWALMSVGRLVSGFLSREMEYDADRYMARMVGGPVFARVLWRLHELSLAENGAHADLGASWRERRLPDNLPKLVVVNVPQIPKQVLADYRQAMGRRTTGLFDTHPADKDRIARARAEADEGIFHLEGPATDLFRNFDSLARAATFDRYRALLGPDIHKDQLVPVSDVVEAQAVTQEGHEALDRYFLNAYNLMQRLPLPWDYPGPPADPKAARQALARARSGLQEAREGNLSAVTRWNEIHARAIDAGAALALLKAGNKIKAADYGLEAPTATAAEAARERATADHARLAELFTPFEEAAARRLTLALSLLEAGAVSALVPDGPARRDEARALYACVAHLGGRVVPEIPPLLRDQQTLLRLVPLLQGARTEALANAVLRAARSLHDRLEEFRWKVGDTIEYPFEHARENVTLARYALPHVPPRENIGEVLQAAETAVDRLSALYHRALGRLAVTAEEVETALGLPPIESEKPGGAGG